MLRSLLLLLASCLLSVSAYAQDILTKQNGEEIQVKVLQITPTEVQYKRFDYQDGPLIVVRKSDVFMVRYANGTKEVFGPQPSQGYYRSSTLPTTSSSPPPPGPVVPGDEESAYNDVHLGGPRIGFTVLTGGVADKADREYGVNPFLTQFGWQFETRVFRLPNGTAGLVEIVPLIAGLEQNKFIPSLNALIGIRGPKGFEFGLGPNLTPVSAGVALAVGTSFRSHGVNFPVNLAVVPGNGGMRFSLLFGFNSRRN